MVTTRSQPAPSHYFVPVSNHRMDGKAMDDTASSATQESADSAAQHVMAVRNAAILLEKTKISADQILFKLHNSTTEYAPTRRAYEALQRVTQNFSICVEYISSALLRFNIPDSRLPAVVDDLLIGADEVYKALNAAADSFFSTSIAGQDDCDMGFTAGKSANSFAASALSTLHSFTLAAFNLNTIFLKNSVKNGHTDKDACSAMGSASYHTFSTLYDAFGSLIESSLREFPCYADSGNNHIHMQFCRASLLSSASTCNTEYQFNNLRYLLETSSDAADPVYREIHEKTIYSAKNASATLIQINLCLKQIIKLANQAAIYPDESPTRHTEIIHQIQSLEEYFSSYCAEKLFLNESIRQFLGLPVISLSFNHLIESDAYNIENLNLLMRYAENLFKQYLETNFKMLNISADEVSNNNMDAHNILLTPPPMSPFSSMNDQQYSMNAGNPDLPEKPNSSQVPSPQNSEMSDNLQSTDSWRFP